MFDISLYFCMIYLIFGRVYLYSDSVFILIVILKVLNEVIDKLFICFE